MTVFVAKHCKSSWRILGISRTPSRLSDAVILDSEIAVAFPETQLTKKNQEADQGSQLNHHNLIVTNLDKKPYFIKALW